ncbi:MAG: response regulator transcription factor [Dysgonamonadaceae bacterium]|jgi:DNA-binding NarL/FixJ family response regulator|nr:response regulator transcription factor [Dysgonamonadaceae bacterium]
MSYPNKNRIIIIEPSPVIRQGLKKILEEAAEFTVTGMYRDLQAFQHPAEDKPFDIILLNPAVINFYRQFAVKDCLADCPDAVIVAIQSGYVDSGTLNDFAGVLSIYDDSTKMRKKLQRMAQAFVPANGSPAADNIDLSDREKEILVSVAKGLTNKEIADKHCISVHTVISHRKNITKKTGIKTVSGLTVYAVFNNLVSHDDLL